MRRVRLPLALVLAQARVVAQVAALAITMAGCSIGGASLSSGFSSSPLLAANASTSSGLGGDGLTARKSAPRGQQVASARDKALPGQYEKAPRGALADRDYSTTKLDADHARDTINAYRQSHNLKPLKLNAALTDAAKAHSRDLAKWDRISHYGSDGSNPWDRVKRAGYNAKVAAENVGTGQVTIEEVMKGWQESAAHNRNLLLDDISDMGIALVQDPKTEFKTFWTLVLAASK